MLTEPTLDRLRALHLGAMGDAYRTQPQDPAIGALSFDVPRDLPALAAVLSGARARARRRLVVEHRVLPRVLARLAINHAEDVIDRTRLGHRHCNQPALVVALVRYWREDELAHHG
jgi:hypothetical protein